jgi:hypothetical protein
VCGTEGCDRPRYCRGLCRQHYNRDYYQQAKAERIPVGLTIRHRRAMQVVARVDEEACRWQLLDYVVRGPAALDAEISLLAA